MTSKMLLPQDKLMQHVLLTGIHLMRTGDIEANLVKLNETTKLSYMEELISQKQTGPEKATLNAADLVFHQSEYDRLTKELEQAHEQSTLPETPSGRQALNELLVRLRLANS
ncbi:MAG: nucleotidyltransferase domain-containing protein [Aureliella sp.]